MTRTLGGGDLDLSGRWRACESDTSLRRAFVAPGFDDEGWEPVEVPGHWRSVPAFSASHGPLLYRTRFETTAASPAPEDERSWLVADGIFYTSDVWLDGAYLGDTEGYFFAHAFEVTGQLADRREHELALEVACPVQPEGTPKRSLLGAFASPEIMGDDPNPGGIWRPVRIERTGPVRIARLRAICSEVTDDGATVELHAVLDASRAGPFELTTSLHGVRDDQVRTLAVGENQVSWSIAVGEPQLWWPWMLGEQALHDLVVEVRDELGAPSDRLTRRMGLRSIQLRDWILRVNGERLFCKGTNLPPARAALGEADPALLAGDVALAREAGLDLLRVHSHVSRPELYEAADEAGMLVWQDLPLHGTYHRSVRGRARQQARELVDLLGHHPCIHLWCAHNEPTPGEGTSTARAASTQVLPTWNRTVLDRSVSRVLQQTDGSRPVVAHSGVFPHPPTFEGTDSHLYLGWRSGEERDLEALLRRWPRLGRFVGELGAQAVPEEASFLEPQHWPSLDWERAERTHGLQRAAFERYVPPADHDSFERWREATQRYQAGLLRRQIEALRRIKYRPCGGFAQFCLADARPAVSASVLDHDRAPKAGFEALRAACAPVIVVADRPPATARPGQHLALDVHVVNDGRSPLRAARVSAEVVVAEPVAASWPPRTRERNVRRAAWEGDVPADEVAHVGRLAFDVPTAARPSRLSVRLALDVADHRATNEYVCLVDDGA